MKFTLSWLKEHLETTASVEEIVHRLTSIGLLVDSVTNLGEELKGFIIAEIIDVKPHPHADRLQVCQIRANDQTWQVVCGAPNARAGLKSVFASPGLQIPASGIVIQKSMIRQVESEGMLCSERELGLSQCHEGIIELPPEGVVGQTYADYKNLNDPLFDIEITPNRGDCLGVRGIARDLSATGIGTLKPLIIPPTLSQFSSPLQVKIEVPDGCPFFTCRLIRHVKNGPSPEWLQQRLHSIGLKSISTLVDITNWMSYDRGRPLHVFDADQLHGDLIIRPAKAGETFLALDENTYALPPDAIVIADDRGPCSLAGIMGGYASRATMETKNVLVESAFFDPICIALAGRATGIMSDARYRFERGVDAAIIEESVEQATHMILDLCGGEPSEIIKAGTCPDQSSVIPFRPQRIQTLGGLELADDKIFTILQTLGFQSEKAGFFKSPSWRSDIKGEADLVEEVLRIQGYDSILPADLPKLTKEELNFQFKEQNIHFERTWSVRRGLVARGLSEAYTWSFLKKEWAEKFGGGHPSLSIVNPISQDMSEMRPSLLPLLLSALARNLNRGQKELSFFEIGHQYESQTTERLMASGIRGLFTAPDHWLGRGRIVDVFDAKADLYNVLENCGFNPSATTLSAQGPSWYHPGRSGTIQLGSKVILGYFGEIHPDILEVYEIQGPIVGFEVFLDVIPQAKNSKKDFVSLSPYQSVERDFSFLMDGKIPTETLIHLIQKIDKNLIRSVEIFDVFQGTGILENQKSIGVRVRLEPQEATLTEKEMNTLSQEIIETAKRKLGAELRS